MTTPEIELTEVTLTDRFGEAVRAFAHSRRGLTLVEIMIVLTIMASIMGIVGFFARGALDNARIKEAESEVANIAQMLTQYYVFRNEYPDNLEQLVDPPQGMAPIVEAIPSDPWGNEYAYNKQNNNEFELYSMGPDGRSGGGDDICPSNQECN